MIMEKKLLSEARVSYSVAVNMAFLILKGECRLAIRELMQGYAILKAWKKELKQKEEVAECEEQKSTYKEMRKVVEIFILWYEEKVFVRSKEQILGWLFSWRHEDIPKDDKDAILAFVEIANIRDLGLPANWRDFIPKF